MHRSELPLFADEAFENLDENKPLARGIYESCQFTNCNMAHAAFAEIRWIDCTFTNCDLSMVKLNKVTLNNAVFKGCKLLGVRFDQCHPFGLSFRFEDCILDLSSFYGRKIRETKFINCKMKETDFTDCDLSYVVFDNCDLELAIFDNTIADHADFRHAHNFSFDLESNRAKKAKFSLAGLPGLLTRYDIEIHIV